MFAKFLKISSFTLSIFLLIPTSFAINPSLQITEISSVNPALSYPTYDTPSINEKGEICYRAADKTVSAILKGDGAQTAAVAKSNDGSGLFDQFLTGLCTINDAGDVTFDTCRGCKAVVLSSSATAAAQDPIHYAIYTRLFSVGSLAPLQLIAETGNISNPTDFKTVALPTLNNLGAVSFSASLQNDVEGIWLKSGGALSTLVDSSGIFSSLGGAFINDSAQLTFGAKEDEGVDVRGIYGPQQNRILGTFNGFSKFSLSSINNSGKVAVLGLNTSSTNGVYVDGQPFLTNQGDFALVDISPFQAVSINDQNDLVFSAVRSDGTQVVFLSIQGGLIPLIQQGDLLPGRSSPVLDINVGRESINNKRQIAIAVTLQDQTELILRLDAASIIPPADNCPTDNAKFEPGICGCGISDADSDGDGILNCQVTSTLINLTNQLNTSLKKVKKLSSNAKKSAVKAQKDLQKQIKSLVSKISALGSKSSSEIKLASNKIPVGKLISSLKSKVLKALKTSDRNYAANRKLALSEIKKFSKNLVL